MNVEYILNQANRILDQVKKSREITIRGAYTEACEFFRVYAGNDSTFTKQALETRVLNFHTFKQRLIQVLEAFIRYAEAGLLGGRSIIRQAQIDTVSGFLSQAQNLLDDDEVHPAAPAMLIGAALEQFLRDWTESAGISISNRKPSIDAYASNLRSANLMTKQDKKDIDSWAGLRNHAAHGEWEQVEDPDRIRIALEGVNLFMRKYGLS